MIYKTLTFCLIENYDNEDLKQLILKNFTYLIRKFETIPVAILLEPWLKQF